MGEVKRRFWIALAAGALVGGGAVLGFPPYVRSQLAGRAQRYGAEVAVGQVMPTWAGVRLRGVSVTFPEIPGVRVWVDDLIVGWRDRRPVSIKGGKIMAVGAMPELMRAAESWYRQRAPKSEGGSSSGNPIGISGFALDWRSEASDSTERVQIGGLALARAEGRYSVAVEALHAELASLKVDIEGGRAVFSRGEHLLIHELASRALKIDYAADLAPEQKVAATAADPKEVEPHAATLATAKEEPERRAGKGARKPASASETANSARKAATPPLRTARAPDSGTPKEPSPRELAARRLYGKMGLLAGRLDGLVAKDARVDIRGARARLLVRGQQLELGPGTFMLSREPAALVLALSPDLAEARAARGKDAPDPLTFSVHIPFASDAKAPLRAELRGGPVWLSQLGLKDGDFGLSGVSQASLESDARFELASDGSTLKIDGGGKLHKLAVLNPRLAKDTVEGLELAWRGKVKAKLDLSDIEVADAELDLGALKLLLNGRFVHRGPHVGPQPIDLNDSAVDVSFEVPLTTCQAAFESLPKALVPKLVGTRLAGSLAVKGHARFDTADVRKTYDVNWDGSLSCRIVEAPADVRVANFKKPFRKVVYTPDGEERWLTFGPGTDSWVPLGSISKFMETGVLTCEDGRFFRHHGFDKEAIINSIRENLAAGKFKRGASTISMQLAKNLYLTREKTLSRKLQEAVLTQYLEQELTKREMLELYLNIIEYGPMVYGIGPAAQHYFHTSASSLSLGQALYVASILQNPKKQYFSAGGAVAAGHMGYLHRLMKIGNKIHLVSDDELEVGLRETVVFGQPQPTLAPAGGKDPYDDVAAAVEGT
jgi:hypothetical protein